MDKVRPYVDGEAVYNIVCCWSVLLCVPDMISLNDFSKIVSLVLTGHNCCLTAFPGEATCVACPASGQPNARRAAKAPMTHDSVHAATWIPKIDFVMVLGKAK